jgi:hypothetical protein
MAARAITACDQCGKADDHPKVHYGLNTWHHDCTPAKVKEEILGGAVHAVDSGILSKVFEAAEGGTRGNDLLAHIQQLHEGVVENG